MINSIIYFLLLNILLVFITKKSFGKCIPFTFIITGLIMYISTYLTHNINVGIIINLFLVLLGIILLIFNINDLKEFKSNYFSTGLYIFLIVSLFFLLFDRIRVLSMWDEFSHWGKMVKEMIRLNDFYSINESRLLVHKDYLPMFTLLEVFISKISFKYSESTLIFFIHLFEFSLITSILESLKLNIKTIFKTLLFIITGLLIILFFDLHKVINTIYIDYPVAIFTSYSIYYVLNLKNKLSNLSILSITLITSFLVLSKQVGIPYYLLILLTYFFDLIFNKIKINIKDIYKLIIIIFIPIILFISWNKYINKFNIDKQFKLNNININEKIDGYKKETLDNYNNAIINKSISTSKIKITYLSGTIISIILLIILILFNKKYKLKLINILIVIIIGSIGYYLFIGITYIYLFSEVEAINLASFDRYLGSFMIHIYILLLMIYINLINNNKYDLILFIIPIIIILSTIPIPRLGYLKPNIFSTKDSYQELENVALYIDENADYNSKVFIKTNNSKYQNGEGYFINYYLNKCQTTYNINDSDYIYEYDKNILKRNDEVIK